MPGMDDARVRLNRAEETFKRLNADIAAFRAADLRMHTVDMEHDRKGNVRMIARIKGQPPKEWGLLAGDVFVDLRAALDYAVYALAVAHTGVDPPPDAHRLEFPICETEDEWRQAMGRRKLAGLNDAAIAYIRSIQPYQPGMGSDTAAILGLDELVGIIKHRFIYVAWARLNSVNLPMKLHGAKITNVVKYSHPGELKDGAVLVTFRLVATAKQSKVEIEASLSTKIVIEPTSWGWFDLVDFVGKIGPYTDHLVGQLEGFLTPGHAAPPKGTPIHLRPWWQTEIDEDRTDPPGSLTPN